MGPTGENGTNPLHTQPIIRLDETPKPGFQPEGKPGIDLPSRDKLKDQLETPAGKGVEILKMMGKGTLGGLALLGLFASGITILPFVYVLTAGLLFPVSLKREQEGQQMYLCSIDIADGLAEQYMQGFERLALWMKSSSAETAEEPVQSDEIKGGEGGVSSGIKNPSEGKNPIQKDGKVEKKEEEEEELSSEKPEQPDQPLHHLPTNDSAEEARRRKEELELASKKNKLQLDNNEIELEKITKDDDINNNNRDKKNS